MQSLEQATNLAPLLLNKSTGEPYLQLPSPHDNVIITPIRPGDIDTMMEHLNDLKIVEWLAGPPHPYTYQDGKHWHDQVSAQDQGLLGKLKDGDRFVDGCPVQCLREVQADGTDVFIGDLSIRRELPQRKWISSKDANNLVKEIGDSTIAWTVGFYLVPSHHRRGIMSAALQTLIDAWAVPRMACRRIIATAMLGNAASVGVFKKLGFEHTRDVEDAVQLPEGRGGHWKTLHVLEWSYSEKSDRKSVV